MCSHCMLKKKKVIKSKHNYKTSNNNSIKKNYPLPPNSPVLSRMVSWGLSGAGRNEAGKNGGSKA